MNQFARFVSPNSGSFIPVQVATLWALGVAEKQPETRCLSRTPTLKKAIRTLTNWATRNQIKKRTQPDLAESLIFLGGGNRI